MPNSLAQQGHGSRDGYLRRAAGRQQISPRHCLALSTACKDDGWLNMQLKALAHLHLLLCQPPPVAPLCLQALKTPQRGHRLCSAARLGPSICPRTGVLLSLCDAWLSLSLPAAECKA